MNQLKCIRIKSIAYKGWYRNFCDFLCFYIFFETFRDRQIFEEENQKLQAMIGQLKESDAQNFSKTRRNRDLVEQVIYDKTQGEQEIKRLKEELERQHERVREMQHQMSRRIAEERSDAERRYNYQVDQLGGDLSNQWEQASKLQLELERQKRVEGDYRRELSQKISQIEELKSEIKGKTSRNFSLNTIFFF